MRFLPPAILALGMSTSALLAATSRAPAAATHFTVPAALPWAPPAWHPDPALLEVLPSLGATPADAPALALASRSVFVWDVDAGRALYARAADERRSIASLTKTVSALAMASEDPDLEQEQCIDQRFWPNRNGARSKLSTGECYHGWDLLGAALVASDNRGAFGMQVLSGLPYEQFVDRMNDVAASLEMGMSSFVDPSGLEDDNLSTARDMTRAIIAVAGHPTLALVATAPEWALLRADRPAMRWLGSTDKLAPRDDVEVLAAKTGYTDTAGYCFTAMVRTASGRTLAFTTLDAPTTGGRWSDASRILAAFR
jgi:D-alanyl-D-alanine endopeptidase (penicillin-binding protein 7)